MDEKLPELELQDPWIRELASRTHNLRLDQRMLQGRIDMLTRSWSTTIVVLLAAWIGFCVGMIFFGRHGETDKP